MNMKCVALAACILFAGTPRCVGAHEVRPAYLELRQSTSETSDVELYDVLWKVPARGNARLPLEVRFPAHCQEATARTQRMIEGAFIDRWRIRCGGKLAGHPISVDGLSKTMTDVLVRLQRANGTTQVVRLIPSASSFTVEDSPNALRVAATYMKLGVEHILLGVDHLLFVLALLLVVPGAWTLVKTVTAFTVAHSITLALAALGFVHLPGPPVEAAIALSIVFVAAEIVRGETGRPGITKRHPWIIAFMFGLLHGFGFAGALAEIGLPQHEIPLALLMFNVGVELGQLAFIAAIVCLAQCLSFVVQRSALDRPVMWNRVAAYGIGFVAAYWTIERVVAILA